LNQDTATEVTKTGKMKDLAFDSKSGILWGIALDGTV